jgi:hypothetical protein
MGWRGRGVEGGWDERRAGGGSHTAEEQPRFIHIHIQDQTVTGDSSVHVRQAHQRYSKFTPSQQLVGAHHSAQGEHRYHRDNSHNKFGLCPS